MDSTPRQDSENVQVIRATASGWMGSALEYYDFFVYNTAAALFFPTLFFPNVDPGVAIVASFATFGVGYVARPFGAFALGHWGDTRGRKSVLIFSMCVMGLCTMGIGLLPTYNQIGLMAPVLLVCLRLIQGFALGGEQSGASSMIIEHAPFGRRGFFASFNLQGTQAGQIIAAAVFLPIIYAMSAENFNAYGWRIPFLLSFFVVVVGLIIRSKVQETPAFTKEKEEGLVPKAPLVELIRESWPDMLRVVFMGFANTVPTVIVSFGAAYAVQAAYGINFPRSLYLWIPVVGNIVAVCVIPFAGNLSDRIGRRPMYIGGMLGSGFLAWMYLYAVSIQSIPLAVAISIIGWGVIYQGYNAIFPSFFPELFSTRTRVSGMAVSFNIGLVVTAFLPMFFAAIAPPGSPNIPFRVGIIAFALTCAASFAAWTAREPYRVRLEDLGKRDAVPVDKEEYMRIRASHPIRRHA
ncbi:MFS transporter [Telmatospirillum sp.]|uniref:MFS transporter n=1 Tax=Telmatospirillum sp. TaxID=2079197 RepID=UPI002842657B|nr:MFS transporter [Telmatospirillum sp.]MDR3436579.1 MFS transporter [Telmatospirillum sp.]